MSHKLNSCTYCESHQYNNYHNTSMQYHMTDHHMLNNQNKMNLWNRRIMTTALWMEDEEVMQHRVAEQKQPNQK